MPLFSVKIKNCFCVSVAKFHYKQIPPLSCFGYEWPIKFQKTRLPFFGVDLSLPIGIGFYFISISYFYLLSVVAT